jgi:hypothetical protein
MARGMNWDRARRPRSHYGDASNIEPYQQALVDYVQENRFGSSHFLASIAAQLDEGKSITKAQARAIRNIKSRRREAKG